MHAYRPDNSIIFFTRTFSIAEMNSRVQNELVSVRKTLRAEWLHVAQPNQPTNQLSDPVLSRRISVPLRNEHVHFAL